MLLYKLQADNGDAFSQYMLGQTLCNHQDDSKILDNGNNGIEVDFPRALEYLKMAAKQYPTVLEDDDHSKQAKIAASSACSYIGRMYLRGEGVDPNYELARQVF